MSGALAALGYGLRGICVIGRRVLPEVMHDDGDAAIRRIERIARNPKLPVRETTHLRDLPDAEACMLHQAARCIRTIGRELPVAITSCVSIGAGIGVTLYRDEVWNLAKLVRQQRERGAAVVIQRSASGFKEGPIARFNELDPEAFGRNGDLNLLLELDQGRIAGYLLLQPRLQIAQIVARESDGFARTAAICADGGRAAARVVEVAGDGFAHVVARIHEPEHDEERHHGSYKIGVGDLPGAPVMGDVRRALAHDDDGPLRDRLRRHAAFPSSPSAGAAGAPPRQTCSTSAKLGRTCSGMARRPISMAICGALPLMAASIRTRSMCVKQRSSSAALDIFAPMGPMSP